MPRYDSRYKQSPIPEFDDPVRAGEQFDEFNVEHDALGREFDLWESPSPDDVTFQRELQRALSRALGTLRPIQELCLRLRYGIPFEDRRIVRHEGRYGTVMVHIGFPQTINEIAQKFSYDPDSVRHIITHGLRRLGHHSRRLRSVLYPEQESRAEFAAPKSTRKTRR